MLNKAMLSCLDGWLNQYRYIDHKIAKRKLELETDNPKDSIRTSKSYHVNKPVEAVIMRWDSDLRLNSLVVYKRAVEATLDVLDDELKAIFIRKWIEGQMVEEIALSMGIKPTRLKAKIERILLIFADFIGVI